MRTYCEFQVPLDTVLPKMMSTAYFMPSVVPVNVVEAQPSDILYIRRFDRTYLPNFASNKITPALPRVFETTCQAVVVSAETETTFGIGMRSGSGREESPSIPVLDATYRVVSLSDLVSESVTLSNFAHAYDTIEGEGLAVSILSATVSQLGFKCNTFRIWRMDDIPVLRMQVCVIDAKDTECYYGIVTSSGLVSIGLPMVNNQQENAENV